MAPIIPASLSAAFAGRLTLSAPELCKLLPMDRSTLYDHIAAGRIAYVHLGSGSRKPRKSFTLEAVAAFLDARTETQAPFESRMAMRRGREALEPEPQGFRAGYAARKAERERQKSEGEGTGFLARRARMLEERQQAKAKGAR